MAGPQGQPVQYVQPRFGNPAPRPIRPPAQIQRIRGPAGPLKMRGGPMQMAGGPRGPPTRLAPPGQRGGLARPGRSDELVADLALEPLCLQNLDIFSNFYMKYFFPQNMG